VPRPFRPSGGEGRGFAVDRRQNWFNRLLRPLLAAGQPQAPAEFRSALRTITHQIEGYITRARLSRTA
jgi:hypothetical protein